MNTKYKIKTENRNGNKIAIIQPALAEKIFKERCSNRPLSMETARLYAKAMRAGDWKPCSQLSFCNGRLDDGQHRLMASILSGIPFEGTIYHHTDPDTFAVFDVGRKRNNADVLAIEGKKNTTALASTLQVLERINSKDGLPNVVGGSSRVAVPTYKIMEVLQKHPHIEASVNFVSAHKKYYQLPIASTIALHYYLTKQIKESSLIVEVDNKGRTQADIFIVDKLLKGLDLTENDPVYVFRRYIDKMIARAGSAAFQPVTHFMVLMGGIQTWNKYIKGETAKVFKLPESNFMPKILVP